MFARRLEAAYGPVSARYYRDYWQRAASAIGAEIEDLGDTFHRIRKDNQWTYVRRHLVMLDSYLSRDMLDDKELTRRLLREHGWQAARQVVYTTRTLDRAVRFLEDLGKSVVVKPQRGSRGRGVTTRIETTKQLVRASALAATYWSRLIVEEFVEGDSYRLLFLDGELIDTVRRDPPSVCGDGRRTVRELIDQENQRRLTDAIVTSLIPLFFDLECKYTLRRQGLTVRSIPSEGQRVQLKSVINENALTENHVHRGEVHRSFRDLGREFGSQLNLRLFGMDVIARDIAAPLRESGGVLSELNIPPGLHYHDLVSDQNARAPVGRKILEAIFRRDGRSACAAVP